MITIQTLLIAILAGIWCEDADVSCKRLVAKCTVKYEKDIDKMLDCMGEDK